MKAGGRVRACRINTVPVMARGVALVLVLWMLVLLTAMAGGIAMTARTGAQIGANLLSSARAEAAADAGIHRGIAELLAPAGSPGHWRSDGQVNSWLFDEMEIRVRMRSETAKIDLNAASATQFAGLLHAVGAPTQEAIAIAEAIVDWRDKDGLRRPHGAESTEYAAAGKTHLPANADFDSIDELRLVLGVTDTVFRAVSDYVTVYSRSASVNAAVADRPVLLTLPGANSALVDAYIERRRTTLENGLPPPPFAQASGSTDTAQDYYSIRAEVHSGDNTHFLREAVVRLTGNPLQPFVILAWRSPGADHAITTASAF